MIPGPGPITCYITLVTWPEYHNFRDELEVSEVVVDPEEDSAGDLVARTRIPEPLQKTAADLQRTFDEGPGHEKKILRRGKNWNGGSIYYSTRMV